MRAETLERRLDKMRAKYWEGLERRESDYNTRGYTKDKAFTKWEWQLNKQITAVRKELAQVLPEKYHFGRMNKSHRQNKDNHKISKHGDNGFWKCDQCGEYFEWNWKIKAHKWKDNFLSCSEHRGMKSIGSITIKKEVFQ
jgi:hypothetical protein